MNHLTDQQVRCIRNHWRMYYMKKLQIKNTEKDLENLEKCNHGKLLVSVITRYEQELKKLKIDLHYLETVFAEFTRENKIWANEDETYYLLNGLEFDIYCLEQLVF